MVICNRVKEQGKPDKLRFGVPLHRCTNGGIRFASPHYVNVKDMTECSKAWKTSWIGFPLTKGY